MEFNILKLCLIYYFPIIFYIWYRERRLTKKINELEWALRKSIKYWNRYNKNLKQ